MTNDKILKERQNCQFQFSKGLNNLVLGKLRLRKKEHSLELLHKKRKLTAVTLDVPNYASPRFRPVDRFWSQGSDICRQAVRERNLDP